MFLSSWAPVGVARKAAGSDIPESSRQKIVTGNEPAQSSQAAPRESDNEDA
jgi:hypothetical protein